MASAFYDEIIKLKEHSRVMWHVHDLRDPLLLYYLNTKVMELKPETGLADFLREL